MRVALGWLLVVLAAPGGGRLVQPDRSPDGLESYRVPVVLSAPADQSMAIDSGSVLTWNRAGRIVTARRVDAQQFREWTGRAPRLAAGEQAVFSDRQVYWSADEVSHTAYLFRGHTGDGRPLRLVWWAPFAPGEEFPLPAESGPALAVRTWPDELRAVRRPRSGTLVWGAELWLQETGGSAVRITRVHVSARAGDGTTFAERTLEGAELAEACAPAEPSCGPDGVLLVRGLRFEAPAEVGHGELVAAVQGTMPGGRPCSALGRFDLLAPEELPAATPVRLPVRGNWRVALGPGDPPHLARERHCWEFDRVDRRGQPYQGDGTRLTDHFAYGQTVYAPAAGDVLAAVETAADAAAPLGGGRFAGAGGSNYLLLHHGNGEYSYLGGLLKGSIDVLPGSRVEAGQPVAKVGCNTTALGRPALVYRLVREPRGAPDGQSLAARFVAYTHLSPGARQTIDRGAPETGDWIDVR